MEESRAALSAVVLAGGRGQRLGGDKADIELVPGQTLLQRSVASLVLLSDDIIVVRRPAAPAGVATVASVDDAVEWVLRSVDPPI